MLVGRRQMRNGFAGVALLLLLLAPPQPVGAIEAFDPGSRNELFSAPPAQEPIPAPAGTQLDDPLQSGDTEWAPLTVEPTPDWSGDGEAWTVQEPTIDFKPESSMIWVLGGDDGVGWFGLENVGMLGYWGPEGIDSAFGYSILFLEGPQRSDLNPRLFGFHYGVQWRDTISGPWSFEVAAAPGVYSDFEDSAREGVRVQGHAFGMWTQPGLQLVLGADYLDRENLKMLPIAGVVYESDDATRFELVFPRPRISRLVRREIYEDRWIYVRAHYGGDSWAVERDTGFADVVTLNEVCLVIGTEAWTQTGRYSTFELGWHFDRELEYSSGLGSFQPEDTLSFRLGSRY